MGKELNVLTKRAVLFADRKMSYIQSDVLITFVRVGDGSSHLSDTVFMSWTFVGGSQGFCSKLLLMI